MFFFQAEEGRRGVQESRGLGDVDEGRGLVFAVPLLLLAVYDFFQRRHTLWRNYPLLAHVRWIMEDLRPYARAYLVDGDREGRPFNYQQRALAYAWLFYTPDAADDEATHATAAARILIKKP